MASVTHSPVVPFTDLSEENHEHSEHSMTGAPKSDLFTAVQEATFKQVQMGKGAGVSNPDDIPCIISPKSKFSQRWDLLMIILLLYTAVVTPFEVAFLSETVPEGLFAINRLVDMCFFADIVINFCLAYEMPDEGLWIVTHSRIAGRYMRSWFVIDVVSTIPFDMFVAVAPAAGVDADSAAAMSNLKVLRVVRLFRLIKLARVLRASRIFKRWETQIAMSYGMQSLIKFALLVVTTTHWLSCLLRLVVELELSRDDRNNPVNYLVSNDIADASEWNQYLVGTYWALMTITTIGYGDVALVTDGEKLVGMLSMAVGGFIYAYIVGAVCGIVATMDEATAKFQQRMDALQQYMKENRIPKGLRFRLREYFYHTRDNQRALFYNELLTLMTPTLRGEVAVLSNGDWVKRVPFFFPDNAEDNELTSFITDVTMRLSISSFAPEELVITQGDRGHQMYIIRKGVVGSNGRIMGGGNYFGEDMILQSAIRLHDVRCLTYLDVYVLSKESLEDILELGSYPHIYKSVRRYVMKFAFKRNIITFLENTTQAEVRAAAGVSAKLASKAGAGVVARVDSDESDHSAETDSDEEFGNTYGNSSTAPIGMAFPEGGAKGKKKLRHATRGRESVPEIFDGLEGDGGRAAALIAAPDLQTRTLTSSTASVGHVDGLQLRDALLLQPDTLPPQLRCPICRGLCRVPTQSPTGHLFCASCIHDALERSPVCPVTGKELHAEQLEDVATNNPVVHRMWGSVPLKCKFHIHGCAWTGEQLLVPNHEEKCTFKSWLSRCNYCNNIVPFADMERHLKTECQQYACPKCAEREAVETAGAPAKAINHAVLTVLAKDYRYGLDSPIELTQMFAFAYGKKPRNVNRDRLWILVRACYSAWKRQEQDTAPVQMCLSAAMACAWFSEKQCRDLAGWLKYMAHSSGWLHDKNPGKDKFDCPYCADTGEWVGITCGTCGQRWDLQDEGAILLR